MSDILVRNDDDQSVKRLHRDQGDGSFAEVVTLPDELVTGSKGHARRVRVDVAQTSFFDGREFRMFKEWATSTTATYVIKIDVPVNTILFEFGIEIEAGDARIETLRSGGTVVEGGSFSETLPRISTNTMTEKPQPPYVGQVLLTAGGSLTGGSVAEGTIIDVLRAKTSGNSNFAQSVGSAAGAERGVSPGIYYWRITLNAAIGVLKARWEERP